MNAPKWRCDCGGLLDVRFQAHLDRKKIVPVALGPAGLLLKLEQLFPTGSYKDRGASVLISKAKELGVTRVVEDSSGNAGCAIAAYAAKAGIGGEILVPESASPGKLAPILLSGAPLRRAPGSREETANTALAGA